MNLTKALSLAFRFLKVHWLRTLITVLAIALGFSGFLLIYGSSLAILEIFKESLGSFTGIVVMEKNAMDLSFSSLPLDLERKLEKVPGVKDAKPLIGGAINARKSLRKKMKNQSYIMYYGVRIADYKNGLGDFGILVKGRYLENEGEALVDEITAKEYSLDIHSRFYIKDKQFTVVGIYKSNYSAFGGSAIIPIEDAREIAGLDKDHVNGFYLEVKEVNDREKVKNIVERMFSDLETYDASDSIDILQEQLGILQFIVFLISLIFAAIGMFVLLNSMVLGIEERRKEFAVLLSQGYSYRDLNDVINAEIGIILVIGLVFAIFVYGFALFKIAQIFSTNIVVPTKVIVVTILVLLIIVFIARIIATKELREIEIIKILREE